MQNFSEYELIEYCLDLAKTVDNLYLFCKNESRSYYRDVLNVIDNMHFIQLRKAVMMLSEIVSGIQKESPGYIVYGITEDDKTITFRVYARDAIVAHEPAMIIAEDMGAKIKLYLSMDNKRWK